MKRKQQQPTQRTRNRHKADSTVVAALPAEDPKASAVDPVEPHLSLHTPAASTSGDDEVKSETPANAPGRRRRLWLFAGVFLLAALLSWGVYWLRQEMDSVGERIYEVFITRTGLDISADTVQFYRLRGVRMTGLDFSGAIPDGGTFHLQAPEATLEVNLADLLGGVISLERLHLEGATLSLEAGEAWSRRLQEETPAADEAQHPIPTLLLEQAFRVTGTDCSVALQGLEDVPPLLFGGLDFDIAHLSGARDIQGRISGFLDPGTPLGFDAYLRFAAPEDFHLRLVLEALELQHVLPFYPELDNWVAGGEIVPTLQITGQGAQHMLVTLEMGLTDFALHNQPLFDTPANGSLTALATYHVTDKLLALKSAQADTYPLGGRLEGSISFAGATPELNLQLSMQDLPVTEILDGYFREQLSTYGALVLELESPHALQLDMVGPINAPDLSLVAQVAAGNLDFTPSASTWPHLDLDFTQLQLAWHGPDTLPEASLSLAGGRMQHAAQDITLEHIYGNIQLSGDRVLLEGLRAELFDDLITGAITVYPDREQVELTLQGSLHNMEAIPGLERLPRTVLAGSAVVQAQGTLTPRHYQIELAINATQADIEHDWWFHKTPGVGANISTLKVDIFPEQSIQVFGEALLDTTPLIFSVDTVWTGEKWQTHYARVLADTVNVATAGKCIRTPYTFRGAPARNGEFTWRRLPETPNSSVVILKGFFDEGAFYPEGTDTPILVRDFSIEATFTKMGEERDLFLDIEAAYGRTPPLTESWIRPIRPDDPLLDERYPPAGVEARFCAQVEELALLPWEGRNFTGEGFAHEERIEVESFYADVGEGNVEGRYGVDRINNVVSLEAAWDRVPTQYLLAHLELPAVLTGSNTGHIDFSYDRDDPMTLRGDGAFLVEDGQFSADYLSVQFEQYLQGDISALPPSMRFSQLRSDIELHGDQVRSPNMLLMGDGVTITGGGHFYQMGDMYYDISVAVSPSTAERIPVLRDNFNIEGHRITQNDIVLGFHIGGPVFNPRGELAGLPGVGVTLVSGAGQVTSDALKVLTVPGQILIDLLKIGGSIVAAPR